MKIVDADGSGEIDYSEWLVATINKKRLLSDEVLKKAFDTFDRDGGGSIDADEVRDILGLGKNVDQELWNQLIEEIDENGDGVIQFDEFRYMMQKLLI